MRTGLPLIAFQLAAAVGAARKRTNDKTIGTRAADGGMIDIVRVTYAKNGRSTVKVVHSGLTHKQALETLATIAA
jgi:hypothetical protein